MLTESPRPQIVIPDVSLSKYVLQRIEAYGGAIAIVDHTRGDELTYKQLSAEIRKCASALHSIGVRKGDIVAICSTNRVQFVVVFLATVLCGAVASPCNPYYRKGELAHIFNIANPCVLFCDGEVVNTIEQILAEVSSLKHIFPFDSLGKSNSFDQLLQRAADKTLSNMEISPKNDVCLLLYSSGTTGQPKGAMLTHHSVIASLCVMKSEMYMSRSSVYYMFIPMFHSFGYTHMLHSIASGTKLVFDTRYNEERMFQAFERHQVTHFSAVPPVLNNLCDSRFPEKYDTSSLQRMMCGAAPIAPHVIETIKNRYNIFVSIGYGLTEISPISISDPIVTKMHSVGTIVPNTKIKVVNLQTGHEEGPGHKGEILVKGPTMMKGYWKNPEADAKTIDKDGWLHTGDFGYYDKDGMLYVEDRLKELIKCKGFQVAPAELEATLIKHPGVVDAAVVGISDPICGEVPKAFVIRKDVNLTATTVVKFIQDKLAHYKQLRGGVEFVDEIPKSPSGKILRKILKMNAQIKSKI